MWLEGYKTKLCAAGIFIVGGLEALGLLTEETAHTLITMLGAGGLAFLRNSIRR